MNKAYCKVGDVANNPVLSIAKLIVFPKFEKIVVKRDKKFGGDINFKSYKQLEASFEAGKLHPADLKKTIAEYLEKVIAPIRKSWK